MEENERVETDVNPSEFLGQGEGNDGLIRRDPNEKSDFLNLEGEFQDDFEEEERLMSSSRLLLANEDFEESEDADIESILSSKEDKASPEVDLDFDYEPGISLANLEFAQEVDLVPTAGPCFFCGGNYESGRIINS